GPVPHDVLPLDLLLQPLDLPGLGHPVGPRLAEAQIRGIVVVVSHGQFTSGSMSGFSRISGRQVRIMLLLRSVFLPFPRSYLSPDCSLAPVPSFLSTLLSSPNTFFGEKVGTRGNSTVKTWVFLRCSHL